jgi:hypothetical protein
VGGASLGRTTLRLAATTLLRSHSPRRPAATTSSTFRFEQELPDYKRYGEQCVKDGRYSEVIRYRDHLQPVVLAIAAALG